MTAFLGEYHAGWARSATAVGLTLVVAAGPLHAQTAVVGSSGGPSDATPAGPDAGKVADIIVTAQRRSENLQNVPISVTVLSGAKLSSSGVSTTQDLGTVTPGLEIGSAAGYLLPHLRGVGTTLQGPLAEASVATYIDGVYIASAPASLFGLSNIRQVEVLKGPQGTLFGRNATGGVIQVTTSDPEPGFSGTAQIGYANYQTISGNMYLEGGTDVLASDIFFSGSHSGKGWGTNLFNGQDVYKADKDITLRSKTVFHPGDHTSVRLILDYENTVGSQYSTLDTAPGTISLFAPLGHGGRPYDVNQDFQPFNRLEGGGASLRVQQDFGAFSLVSLSAYRRSSFGVGFDADFTTVPAVTVKLSQNNERNFSQELELQSSSASKLKWVVGLFYFNADGKYDPSETQLAPALSPLTTLRTTDDQRAQSVAVFGQATYPIFLATNLTLGARYTYERRGFVATTMGFSSSVPDGILLTSIDDMHKTAKKPTFRVALDHRFSPELLGYASFNSGFKSGGFNSGVPTAPPFSPETLNAYEIGLKGDLFDRKVRINPAFFYYDYKNIQVEQAVLGQVYFLNGPSAQLYGLDVDVEAVLARGLTLSGGLSLLHATFSSFPNAVYNIQLPTGGTQQLIQSADGNNLPFAPKRTFYVTADYQTPIGRNTFSFNATYSYNSGYSAESDNILRQPSYNMVNTSASFELADAGVTISIFGRNLGNARVASFLASSSISSLRELEAPRTYGVTGKVKF